MPSPSKEEALFNAALEQRTLQERAAYLASACAGDEALLRRLQELLRAHDDSIGPLDSLPAEYASTVDQPLTERPSDIIGRYKLREQIGEGGMGTVWVAEQSEPVKRRVALKLIKPGMDSRQVLARFEAERQALALMDHPNIAKVFDGGMTDEGRPFFVMEYVKGVPITEYCDNAQLPIRERLKLFIPVCQAVQHAHQKGIIHRDLKPSNILVCLYDGVPVPKVIDFGLAKAISQPLTERTIYTAHGVMVGTPSYMSPEQAEFNNLDIDTRSDIYSLGVVLYELLTGTTPLEKQQFNDAAFHEILRLIKEVEPPKPSTKLSSSENLPSIAAQRGVEPAQLRRVVRGDLDWIVMKSLEKERSRRYETANGLARDIERHIHDEPVIACPPSLSYRLRKIARRHKAAVVATAAIVLTVVLGLIGTTWQAFRATIAEHDRTIQRDLAVKNEADALANLQRAQKAERNYKESLLKSYLDQAQARRFSGRIGRRFESLAAIQKAAEIRPSQELRNEAIACMALLDLRVAKEWDGCPGDEFEFPCLFFDSNLEYYARSDEKGNISVRRVDGDQAIIALPGPGQSARQLLFSPDGRLLAANYHEIGNWFENQVCLWSLKDGKKIMDLSRQMSLHAMHFSPDSRMLSIGHQDRSIRFYSTTGGNEVQKFEPGVAPIDLRFDPRGERLAVCGHSQNLVEIRDAGSGEILRTIRMNTPDHPTWHPDGQILAVASGSSIDLWDVTTGTLQRTVVGHPNSVIDSLAFNHVGNLLASTGWDGRLGLWDAHSGKKLLEFEGVSARGWGQRLQFSPDDRLLGYNISGTKLQLWEVTQPKECKQLFGTGRWDAAFHPLGRVAVVADDYGTRLWDLALSKPIANLSNWNGSVHFDPKGECLFTTTPSGVFRWPIGQLETNNWMLGPPQTLRIAPSTQRAALSEDGKRLAVANYGGKGAVIRLDDQGKEVPIHDHPRMSSICISPDLKLLATGTHQGLGVKIWDGNTGVLICDLPGTLYSARAIDFTPNGRWLLTAHHDEYCLWEVGTWKLSRRIVRKRGGAGTAAAFSPDGNILAIASTNNTLSLIDMSNGDEIAILIPPDRQNFTGLRFNHDGTRLAVSASGVLQVWDLHAIRQQLSKMGLDWDLPPYPAEPAPMETPPPLVVEVIHAEYYQKRGVEHALAGKWQDALDEFRRARQHEMSNLWLWLFEATGLLAVNDQAGYEQLCSELPERFGNVTQHGPQRGVAHVATIGPNAVRPEKWRQIRLLAERSVALAPTFSLNQERLGAVCYRSGDYHAAIENLRLAIRKANWIADPWSPGADDFGSAWTKLFLAMAHHQAGDSAEAQRWLRLGEQQVATDARSGQPWYDRRIAHMLLAEARAVLSVPSAAELPAPQ